MKKSDSASDNLQNVLVEIHCYMQITDEEKTGYLVHAVVHKFTVRSVACNKLQCQKSCGGHKREHYHTTAQ